MDPKQQIEYDRQVKEMDDRLKFNPLHINTDNLGAKFYEIGKQAASIPGLINTVTDIGKEAKERSAARSPGPIDDFITLKWVSKDIRWWCCFIPHTCSCVIITVMVAAIIVMISMFISVFFFMILCAFIGSIVPGPGTLIGAIAGIVIGAGLAFGLCLEPLPLSILISGVCSTVMHMYLWSLITDGSTFLD